MPGWAWAGLVAAVLAVAADVILAVAALALLRGRVATLERKLHGLEEPPESVPDGTSKRTARQ